MNKPIVYPNGEGAYARTSKTSYQCGGCGELIERGEYHTRHFKIVGERWSDKYKETAAFCCECYPFRFVQEFGIPYVAALKMEPSKYLPEWVEESE